MVGVIRVYIGQSCLNLAVGPVVVEHLHGDFKVVESSRVDPANLLIGYFFAHYQPVELLSGGTLTDLE